MVNDPTNLVARLVALETEIRESRIALAATQARTDAMQTAMVAALGAPAAAAELRGTLTTHINECRTARLEDVEDRKAFRIEVTDEFNSIRTMRAQAQNELRKFLVGIVVLMLGGMGTMAWYIITAATAALHGGK